MIFIYHFVTVMIMRFALCDTLLVVLVVELACNIWFQTYFCKYQHYLCFTASITFMIHYNAVKEVFGYLKHLSEPSVLMLPVNIIGRLAFAFHCFSFVRQHYRRSYYYVSFVWRFSISVCKTVDVFLYL